MKRLFKLSPAERLTRGILHVCAWVILGQAWQQAVGKEVSHAIYVNRYFEVRDHDAPTKYVFNGDTRVAEVTGSLSTNTRIQRMRLFPGWNLCSSAVNSRLSTSVGEGQSVPEAYRWSATVTDWVLLLNGETVPAGTVFWLKSGTNTVLSFTGNYSDPTNRIVKAGGDFLPSAGLGVWSLANSVFGLQPLGIALWRYDKAASHWLSRLPPPLELQAEFPAVIAPGEAVFVRAEQALEVEMPGSTFRIRYYHQDHLGSSSCESDSEGEAAEQFAFYPSGTPRDHALSRGLPVNYAYTQKEQDEESGLHYFEARYLGAKLSRFLTTDPLTIDAKKERLLSPQKLHLYSYVANRPLNHVDPTANYPTVFKGIDVRFLGKSAHRVSITRTLSQLGVSSDDIKTLKDGVLLSDSGCFQERPFSFMHGMRAGAMSWEEPSQSVESAKRMANAFIRANLEGAARLESGGNHKQALTMVAIAMHVLQDYTSPSHYGFQEWRNEPWYSSETIHHGIEEFFVPKPGGPLDEATLRIWRTWELAKEGKPVPQNLDFFIGLGAEKNGGSASPKQQ